MCRKFEMKICDRFKKNSYKRLLIQFYFSTMMKAIEQDFFDWLFEKWCEGLEV